MTTVLGIALHVVQANKERIRKLMFCKSCGKRLHPSDSVCHNCGTPVRPCDGNGFWDLIEPTATLSKGAAEPESHPADKTRSFSTAPLLVLCVLCLILIIVSSVLSITSFMRIHNAIDEHSAVLKSIESDYTEQLDALEGRIATTEAAVEAIEESFSDLPAAEELCHDSFCNCVDSSETIEKSDNNPPGEQQEK